MARYYLFPWVVSIILYYYVFEIVNQPTAFFVSLIYLLLSLRHSNYAYLHGCLEDMYGENFIDYDPYTHVVKIKLDNPIEHINIEFNVSYSEESKA